MADMPDWSVVFPELEWISDASLRRKVADVWDEATQRGGWDDDEIEQIPFTLLVSAGGVTLTQHTRLVTNLCRSIAEQMKGMGGFDIDDERLIAGALLHDVGKMLEYRKDGGEVQVSRSGKFLRHPLSGMGLAMKGDLPEEVCHIIAVHSREGEGSYRSPEAVILHHADFIAFETTKAVQDAPPRGK
jgi:putative nucleotidyltransferase with HDIG domain